MFQLGSWSFSVHSRAGSTCANVVGLFRGLVRHRGLLESCPRRLAQSSQWLLGRRLLPRVSLVRQDLAGRRGWGRERGGERGGREGVSDGETGLSGVLGHPSQECEMRAPECGGCALSAARWHPTPDCPALGVAAARPFSVMLGKSCAPIVSNACAVPAWPRARRMWLNRQRPRLRRNKANPVSGSCTVALSGMTCRSCVLVDICWGTASSGSAQRGGSFFRQAKCCELLHFCSGPGWCGFFHPSILGITLFSHVGYGRHRPFRPRFDIL